MFLCSRKRCRERCLPKDNPLDIKAYPDHFEVQYILFCGHTLCEKCLYMTIQVKDRDYICDQCGDITNFSSRAFTCINSSQLSTSKRINRLNEDCAHEIPLDAYALGLAFSEGRLVAAPAKTDIYFKEEEIPKPKMEDKFKYNKEEPDQENIELRAMIPKPKRQRTIPLLLAMHKSRDAHAECGVSIKKLGNMERKLTKEFYLAKMRLREKFHILHTLLQLEELRGITLFENNYKKRKEEYARIEKGLYTLRRQFSEIFKLEHETLDQIIVKVKKLNETREKPCRINWRQQEVAYLFDFEVDEYLLSNIKNCLTLDTTERESTVTLEPYNRDWSEPLQLYESPYADPPEKEKNVTPMAQDPVMPILEPYTHIAHTRKEIMKLVKILSPDLFYCMLWDEPERINMVNNQIENWCTSVYTHPPTLASLKPGGNIFVFSDSLKVWCRARLLSINEGYESSIKKKSEPQNLVTSAFTYYTSRTVDVQLLDHGGIEKIPIQKIRVPFEELFDSKSYPPLAVKCGLYNVKPYDEEWSELAVDTINDFCGDRKIAVYIRELVGDLHKVDIYRLELSNINYNTLSLREVLFWSKIARSPLNEEDIIRFHKTEIYFRNHDKIPTSKTETVLITDIQSPDIFHVTLYSEQEAFHRLHERLKIYFDLADEPYSLYIPAAHRACIVLDNGTFYRGLVKKASDPDEPVLVEFVDFGHTKTVACKDLRLVRDEFLKTPIFAIPCKLGDVAPCGAFKWTTESIEKFKELVSGESAGPSHIFNLSVITYESDGKHVVNLRRYTGTEYISINAALVTLKGAISTGPLTMNTPDADTISGMQVTKFDDRIFKTLEEFDVCGYNILKELVDRNREAKSSKIDSLMSMRISHWISPDEFYVQLTIPEVRSYFVCYENKLADDYIAKLDDPVPNLLDEIQVDDPVIYVVRTGCSSTWKRGIILQREHAEDDHLCMITTEEGEKLQIRKDKQETYYDIYARDFGFVDRVPRRNIWKLDDDSPYMKDGDFCLKCHLSDLAPAGGGTWTKTARETFAKMIVKYNDKYLFIAERYLPSEKPESVGCDVFGKETCLEDAFAQIKVKYHSFKNLLVNQGYALPTREISLSDIEDKPDSDEESLYNSYTNRSPRKKENSVLTYIRSARANIRKQLDNVTIKFYKEAEKPTSASFIGMPTEVEKGLKVWFRIMRDDHQPINIVNRTISRALKDQESLLPFVGEPIHGRACTAFFEFDKTWNRAEIVYAVGQDRCHVRFVDYGNEAFVEKEHLSSQVFNLEIPKLALYGIIAELKPTIDESKDDTLFKAIHRIIVDEKCVFNWENFQSLQDMQVSIIKLNGELLKTELLATNLVVEDTSPINYFQPTLRNIRERMYRVGFKEPTLVLKKDTYYPVNIYGKFYENCTFFHVKMINEPLDDLDQIINARNNEFKTFMERFRSAIPTLETDQKYQVNAGVAVQFTDSKWYRGLILQTIEQIFQCEYRVLLVDLGYSTIVEGKKLRKISYKWASEFPLFAIPAKVHNIEPRKRVWKSDLCDRLEKEVINNETKIVILVKNDSIPYDIEVFKADPDDQRVPTQSLWTSLFKNGELVEIKEAYEQKPEREQETEESEITL